VGYKVEARGDSLASFFGAENINILIKNIINSGEVS